MPARSDDSAPLYRQVRRRILEAIGAGEWRPGAAIPAEKRLCERFGISMGTLRKAVDELCASGVLQRQQGRGTFVARHSQDRYLFNFFHLVGPDGAKQYPQVRFLQFASEPADRTNAALLGVKPQSRLLHLSNLLSLADEPVSLDEIYLPSALFPKLSEQRLRGRQATLYQMYQDEFGVSVVRARERVVAVAATREQARWLQVPTGTPLLRILRLVTSFQERPVELRLSFVNTQRCEYRPAEDAREDDRG